MRGSGIIFFLSFVFVPLTGISAPASQQDYNRAQYSLSVNQKKTERFFPDTISGTEFLKLETPFAKADFINEKEITNLRGLIITKVQLVYTTFAVSSSFNQQQLNLQRLKNLFALDPGIFSSALTEWQLVGQTGATSPETGRTFFHGFVIYYRPASSDEELKNEFSYIENIFRSVDKKGSSGIHSDSIRTGDKILTLPDGSKITLDRNIPEDSLWRYLRPSYRGLSVIDARYNNREHSSIRVTEQAQNGNKLVRIWSLEDHYAKPEAENEFKLNPNDPDSVVLSAFHRNNWKNTIIVTDVTSSMSPYTAQTLSIISSLTSQKKIAACIFFNDGDGKKTEKKNIGSTGGIYMCTADSFDTILNTAQLAMKNGNGGDIPENDLEAIIYGVNKINSVSDVVLIADNYSSPRDLELADKIGRPVHIILCGARVAVNPDYLFLARQTGGSIHTLTQDIYDLDKLKDGDVIVIGRQHFLLHGEHFVCTDTWDDPK
ncbi:MAG: hypothetical protein HY064_05835 [Bacteroidetes bacterium]|nr:hypothetical protein [Bacteroidota bacterium]